MQEKRRFLPTVVEANRVMMFLGLFTTLEPFQGEAPDD